MLKTTSKDKDNKDNKEMKMMKMTNKGRRIRTATLENQQRKLTSRSHSANNSDFRMLDCD